MSVVCDVISVIVRLPPGWDPAVARSNKRIDEDGSTTQTFDAVPRLWENRDR